MRRVAAREVAWIASRISVPAKSPLRGPRLALGSQRRNTPALFLVRESLSCWAQEHENGTSETFPVSVPSNCLCARPSEWPVSRLVYGAIPARLRAARVSGWSEPRDSFRCSTAERALARASSFLPCASNMRARIRYPRPRILESSPGCAASRNKRKARSAS